ncbi:MAG: amidohydrolase family protein [Acidipila sp.]|nr:amidohydrolase family protein [Acidipila sp.]
MRVVAITHVAVVDLAPDPAPAPATELTPKRTTIGTLRRDFTVVVVGERITAVRPSRDIAIPAGARVVDATGKYLIPGLWDMHVHLTGAGEPTGSRQFIVPLLVVNGITGVRDMGGPLDALLAIRQEIWSAKVIGPRIALSGPYLDGPHPAFQPSIPLSDAPAARLAVQWLSERGVDFIKVQSLLPRDAYFAIAEEARRLKMPFAGHVPETVGAAEASDAGQKSIEHLTNVLLGCGILKNIPVGNESDPGAESAEAKHERQWEQMLLSGFDSKKAAALFAVFLRNRTWQSPTLIMIRNMGLATANEELLTDPRLAYVPEAVRKNWTRNREARLAGRSPEALALRRAFLEKQIAVTGAMRRAGVEFLAGTDTAAPYVFPGSSLHEELELFVQAGFTPAEALASATVNPALYLGMEDKLGAVETGKLADLVLLDGNPLEDIRNTRKIFAVMLNGRLLDRWQLDEIKARVAARGKQ